jgi:hypothetical protein
MPSEKLAPSLRKRSFGTQSAPRQQVRREFDDHRAQTLVQRRDVRGSTPFTALSGACSPRRAGTVGAAPLSASARSTASCATFRVAAMCSAIICSIRFPKSSFVFVTPNPNRTFSRSSHPAQPRA